MKCKCGKEVLKLPGFYGVRCVEVKGERDSLGQKQYLGGTEHYSPALERRCQASPVADCAIKSQLLGQLVPL